jgi:hypothetical protein
MKFYLGLCCNKGREVMPIAKDDKRGKMQMNKYKGKEDSNSE